MTSQRIFSLCNKLLEWYEINKRTLPWRDEKDVYKIWLSEIILQQTRVNQGLPYYLKFIKKFPTLKKLAQAEEQAVLKSWQGLGYYVRARNLHFAAQQVMQNHKGIFPHKYKDLIKLKGVGEYTAAAVSSIVAGEKQIAIDGNVIRVISRWLGITDCVQQKKTLQQIRYFGTQLINLNDSGTINQALMEWGALYCVPQNPSCNNCSLQDYCIAYKKNIVELIPFKSKKTKKQTVYFHYFIVESNKKIAVQKRTDKNIWQHLYEFPLIEKEQKTQVSINEINELLNTKIKNVKIITTKKHVLTHKNIFATLYSCEILGAFPPKYQWLSVPKINKLPLSTLMQEFVKLI